MNAPRARPGAFSAWTPVALYAGLIFALSSMERLTLPLEPKFHSDWILHGVEYAVLGLLLARALDATRPSGSFRFLVLISVALAALYGVSDEWHQSFVPNRDASAADVAADGLGAWLGAWLWARRRKKQEQGA